MQSFHPQGLVPGRVGNIQTQVLRKEGEEKTGPTYKITNIKFSCRVWPPLSHQMFNDIGLHYWAGPDRYILRLDKYVYTIMCTGKFVNVTGCICADEFEKALFRLKSNVRDPNLTFSLKKCDTISAVSKIKKSIFGRIMKTQASATRFKIKLYHNIPYRLNVSLQIPLKTSPNICANIFTSGSVCIFGARQKEDIDFFLHYINDT